MSDSESEREGEPGGVRDQEAKDADDARAGDEDDLGEAPDAVFDALWERVLVAWDEDKPHQLALSYAIEHHMLPVIAGRYRTLANDPEKGERAKKKIDAIIVAATQMLMATKTPALVKIPWTWTASVAVAMILVIAFLAYKLFGHR